MMVSQSLSLMWSDLMFGILGTDLYIGPFAVFPFIIRREPAARWAAIGALLVTIFAFFGYMRRVLPKQTYRRTIGGSVWHSSSRCKYWPTENFDEVSESPQFGVCSICVKIENRAGRYIKDGWYGSKVNVVPLSTAVQLYFPIGYTKSSPGRLSSGGATDLMNSNSGPAD